ncbi:metal ABC transporter permease [Caldimonas sp.]|uniref:metal ABC transporter permease n=1 Tax=Caldimonas sp. TaxID=2838790 RepID=UPI00391ACCCC
MNELSVLGWPLAAGVLVLLSHVPLGLQVLRRGIVFIDLAVAQVAALGVLIADSLTGGDCTVSALAGVLAALAGAALVAALSRTWPERREALIGLVYVAAAVAALLWVSADPHGGQKLAAVLAGDVLWVLPEQLAVLAAATAVFLVLHRVGGATLWDGPAFYPAFAVLVSLSVPLLGLYLVFATLIVPALAVAARLGRAWAGVLLGALAQAAGLLASLTWDLPSGPCVVLALMAAGLLVALTGLWRPPRRAGATLDA